MLNFSKLDVTKLVISALKLSPLNITLSEAADDNAPGLIVNVGALNVTDLIAEHPANEVVWFVIDDVVIDTFDNAENPWNAFWSIENPVVVVTVNVVADVYLETWLWLTELSPFIVKVVPSYEMVDVAIDTKI